MTVKQLRTVLENLDDDDAVMIEYMPRRHEYITEFAVGVRITDDETVTIFGVTELDLDS
jgi:hypothetical protein